MSMNEKEKAILTYLAKSVNLSNWKLHTDIEEKKKNEERMYLLSEKWVQIIFEGAFSCDWG